MTYTSTNSDVAPPLFGVGIYDVAETARLIKRDPDTVARWTQGDKALHEVDDRQIMTFLDLISLLVISELIRRRVPRPEIRKGGEYLSRELDTNFPFAHKGIATAGAAFFGNLGEWIDVGKGGQLAFQQAIREYLRPVIYGEDDLASVWKPHSRILINPAVQAGAPCIEGTRVPTQLIAELAESPEDYSQIADDYRLTLADVKAAVKYERDA